MPGIGFYILISNILPTTAYKIEHIKFKNIHPNIFKTYNLTTIFSHSIPENPVICKETKVSPTTPSFINWLTLIRSGDYFIMNYSKKTVAELKTICKELNIKGFAGKNKQTLIELIQQSGNISTDQDTPLPPTANNENTPTPPVKTSTHEDTYTKDLLKEQYAIHKSYVNGRIHTTQRIGVKVRLPCIPEDISENIVKQIIHNKLNDRTSRWDCKLGDLYSQKEGKQECKCFTSDGPPSFTPSSNWDVIYFLDARNWLSDKFILYRIPLKRTSDEWKNIRVSKAQTFEDQAKQGRRPRITWESLYPQISSYCTKVFEGTFDDIFVSLEENEK
jgi:hypothetical protein